MVVERPRAGDAIGVALRDAYARQRGIPDDIVALLDQLGAVASVGRYDTAISYRG